LQRVNDATASGLDWAYCGCINTKARTSTVQLSNYSTSDQHSPSRKLALKKETLRQLTNGELRRVAGGNPSGGSAAISSGTSVISSGTSVISSGTSVISVSISISGR
jgi:hypothetical protein